MKEDDMEKILIVDDALFMRVTIKKILAGAGYEHLLEAGDGEEACRICHEEKPQLVLMDISMPKMDGIEALRRIREELPDTTIVMCSAVGQDAMMIQAAEYGAVDFIVKPFNPEQLIRTVQCILHRDGGDRS